MSAQRPDGLVVIVCGGRKFKAQRRLEMELDRLPRPVCIVHGAAPGADTLAGNWAKSRKQLCIAVPAQWNKYGLRAGPIRNQLMLDRYKPNAVIAFDGGVGTDDMMTRARTAGVRVVNIAAGETWHAA